MAEDGWICDAVDAPNESWISDVPWFKANERHGHRYIVRDQSGIRHCVTPIKFTLRSELEQRLFYGNEVKITNHMVGFSSYYCTIDKGACRSAANVIDAGGKEALTSAWVISWGPHSVYMVTPDGVPPSSGLSEAAIIIADWRFVVRVANIASDLSKEELEGWLAQAAVKLPTRLGDQRNVRTVIYMNSTIKRELDYYRGVFVRSMDDLRCDEDRVS